MQNVRTACWLILVAALLVGCTRSGGDSGGVAQRQAPTQCGTERWGVKTLTDPEAERVDLTPSRATVEQLSALPVPAGFNRDAARLPPEFQSYTVEATLVEFKEEDDHDIHLVIVGPSGKSMIAEIPEPTCAEGSRLEAEIARAKVRFIESFGEPNRTSWSQVNAIVTVTGVLFFDVPHGQIGVAPNAVELHPVFDTSREPRSQEQLSVALASLTSPVSPGNAASITVKTAPSAACTIAVSYKSGPSRAMGLEPKTATQDGVVSWAWIVGTRTTPGRWPITVTCSAGGRQTTLEASFAVQ